MGEKGWEVASAITISVSKERLSSQMKPAHPRGDRLMFASFRARHNNSACILASGRFEESRLALSLRRESRRPVESCSPERSARALSRVSCLRSYPETNLLPCAICRRARVDHSEFTQASGTAARRASQAAAINARQLVVEESNINLVHSAAVEPACILQSCASNFYYGCNNDDEDPANDLLRVFGAAR